MKELYNCSICASHIACFRHENKTLELVLQRKVAWFARGFNRSSIQLLTFEFTLVFIFILSSGSHTHPHTYI